VNHPPKGVLPNVFSHSFAWPEYVQYVAATSGDTTGGAGGNTHLEEREMALINKVAYCGVADSVSFLLRFAKYSVLIDTCMS
jgi:hypothetical protein